ncbi:MAG: glycoside hydrolase family 2 protein [Bacteroidales bacterium]|nr:glycoside hydrolase family 2 protein [Bacteroidales bacterium]
MFQSTKHFITAALTAGAALLLLAACQRTDTPATPETGQLGWPEITSQTKPWTRWWWPASAVGKSDIDTMLEQYDQAGLGGMEVTTIYGAKGYEDQYLEYLTPAWMDLFAYTLEKAGKKGLGIDLANASGWPFGGPWVEPDDACRYLAPKIFTLKGGERIQEPLRYTERAMVRTIGIPDDISRMEYPIARNDSLQQHAYEQVRYPQDLPLIAVTAHGPDGAFEDLTARVGSDGSLDWTAPDGDWTVCALFLGWHGKLVERAGPGGEGDVIDHFSAGAIDRYLAKFDEAFKGYDVSNIRYYFNDSYEVDDAQGNSDWTPDFFEKFQARCGYDLRPHMAELLGVAGSKEIQDRVVFDYRETIGELLRETYSVRWQAWAAAQGKGIRNQAHGSPANIMDLYGVSDVPETEGRSIIGMKTASSAAHVTDKPLTSAEACTWLNEHFHSTLGDAKTSVDTYFLSGVNHIFYHGTCLSPDDAPWPGWLFYAAVHFQPTNPFWTDFGAFNAYVARCQSFLQAGHPDSDILLFFDATDLLSERGREPLLFHMGQNTPAQSALGKAAEAIYNRGYTWDYITDKMVCENIHADRGDIVTTGGTRFRTLIVPECGKMYLSTFEKLLELARKGATILIENELPADVPGLSKLEQNRARLEKLKASLHFTQENGLRTARVGKGRICVSSDLDALLSGAGVSRERMYDLGLQCISRVKDDGGRYYFVKNPTPQKIEGWVPVDALCGSIGVYDPMDGRFGYGRVRNGEDGKAEVWLSLEADQSLLLETFSGSYEGDAFPFYQKKGEGRTLTGDWTVSFTDGGPALPASRTISRLTSWTLFGKPYEIFSGTAEYRYDLPPVQAEAEAWELDLGDVRESASVWLDGKCLGTLFEKPWTVRLTQEQASRGGKLVVKVSNSMANRIIDMDRTGKPWKVLYNANIQPRLPISRSPEGFSAARWDFRESGLLGPVNLTPVALAE